MPKSLWFIPDYKNIKEITLYLGKQENAWKHVWNFYANSPLKYPQIEPHLREAKPDDMGTGIFSIPDESWPQINEEEKHNCVVNWKNYQKMICQK